MSCSPFDLRDYVLNELVDSEGRLVETHVKACGGCREELERLRATRAALLALPEVEIPQRIGFISDPVFEPSPLGRGWRLFWQSGARLGFASAAMLSIAILVFALTRPAPAPPAAVAQPDVAKLEARFDQRLEEAVRKAVAATEARQEQKTSRLLAAAEFRHRLELKSIQLAVEENLSVMEKRQQQLRLAYLASADAGAPR